MQEFGCRNINQHQVIDALRGGGCDVLVEANWREGRASCLRPAATSLGDTQTQRHSDTQTHVADNATHCTEPLNRHRHRNTDMHRIETHSRQCHITRVQLLLVPHRHRGTDTEHALVADNATLSHWVDRASVLLLVDTA